VTGVATSAALTRLSLRAPAVTAVALLVVTALLGSGIRRGVEAGRPGPTRITSGLLNSRKS
jgi:hypothetical protein